MRRERQINGPIMIVVFSVLAWACGIGLFYLYRTPAHRHTEECWDR